MLPKTAISFFIGLLVSTFFISELAAANTAPTTNGTIPTQILGVGTPATTLDVSSYFSDPDSDTLTYTATSSDTAIVTVSVSNTTVSMPGVALGTATITVTATDPGGLTATQTFSVTVAQPNKAPVAVGTMPDQTATVGGSPATIDMSSYFSDPDGDTLTYTASVDTEIAPNAIQLTISFGKTLTVSATTPGTIQLTVTARDRDPGGLTATQSCTITMFEDDNRPPAVLQTISDQTLKVNEKFTIDALDTYFNDPNGDTLGHIFFSSDTSIVGFTISFGGVTFRALAAGTATIDIVAEDPDGLTATLSFTITVEGVGTPNKAPVAVGTISDKTLKVGGDALTVDVSSNFSDPDDELLSYIFHFSDPSKINASVTGSTVLLTGVAAGTVTVTVRARDTGNLSADQTFSLIVVSSQNRAPTTNDTIPAQILGVGTPATTIDVSGNFSDPDSDTLTYTATSSNTKIATVSVSNTTISITGVALGTATITVTATDPSGLTATQTFSVTVSPPNRAPVAVGTMPDQTATVGGSPATIDMTNYFSDPDGDTLTYTDSIDTEIAPNAIQITISFGRTLTISATKPGTIQLTVTATDPGGLTATQSCTITMFIGDNRPPAVLRTISDQTLKVNEQFTIDAMDTYFTDPNGDTLGHTFFSSDTSIVGFTIGGPTGGATFLALAAGTAKIDIEAEDPSGLTATLSFSITVEGGGTPNKAPVAVGTISAKTLKVGGDALTVDVSSNFSDPDGDSLSYAFGFSDPSKINASVTGATALLTGVAAGTVTVTATATDTANSSATQTFSLIVVSSQNRAPTTNDTIPAQILGVGTPATTLDVSSNFTDPDSDTLSYTATSSDTKIATVGVSNTTVSITGVALGTATITVTATDPSGLTAKQTFSVTVSAPNRAPVVVGTIPKQTLIIGGDAVTLDVSSSFSDPDGDPLSYAFDFSDPSKINASVTGATVLLTGVAAGTVTVTVTATDTTNLSATQTFTVEATEGTQNNNSPVAVGTIPDQTMNILIVRVGGNTLTLNVSGYFSDPDDDILTYTANSSDTAITTVSVSNTSVSITAVATGTATITVTATDPSGLTATQTFSVTVSPANNTLVAVGTIPDQTLPVGDSTITLDVSSYFSATDNDTLTYTANSSDTAITTVSVSNTSVSITAVAAGTATIIVTARDATGLSATQTFSVTVSQSNNAPVAVGTIPDQTATVGGIPVTIVMSNYFSDPDGDTLTYTTSFDGTDIESSALTIENWWGIITNISATKPGKIQLTVTATDPDGLTATQSCTITVNPQSNRVPVLGEDLAPSVDLNGDDVVNILDLVLVANQIGQPATDNPADVNEDGVINILDLVLVASQL